MKLSELTPEEVQTIIEETDIAYVHSESMAYALLKIKELAKGALETHKDCELDHKCAFQFQSILKLILDIPI